MGLPAPSPSAETLAQYRASIIPDGFRRCRVARREPVSGYRRVVGEETPTVTFVGAFGDVVGLTDTTPEEGVSGA